MSSSSVRASRHSRPRLRHRAEVPFFIFMVVLGQGNDPEHARAHPLGDPLDRAPFPAVSRPSNWMQTSLRSP
jgi:hypothetical protein